MTERERVLSHYNPSASSSSSNSNSNSSSGASSGIDWNKADSYNGDWEAAYNSMYGDSGSDSSSSESNEQPQQVQQPQTDSATTQGSAVQNNLLNALTWNVDNFNPNAAKYWMPNQQWTNDRDQNEAAWAKYRETGSAPQSGYINPLAESAIKAATPVASNPNVRDDGESEDVTTRKGGIIGEAPDSVAGVIKNATQTAINTEKNTPISYSVNPISGKKTHVGAAENSGNTAGAPIDYDMLKNQYERAVRNGVSDDAFQKQYSLSDSEMSILLGNPLSTKTDGVSRTGNRSASRIEQRDNADAQLLANIQKQKAEEQKAAEQQAFMDEYYAAVRDTHNDQKNQERLGRIDERDTAPTPRETTKMGLGPNGKAVPYEFSVQRWNPEGVADASQKAIENAAPNFNNGSFVDPNKASTDLYMRYINNPTPQNALDFIQQVGMSPDEYAAAMGFNTSQPTSSTRSGRKVTGVAKPMKTGWNM